MFSGRFDFLLTRGGYGVYHFETIADFFWRNTQLLQPHTERASCLHYMARSRRQGSAPCRPWPPPWLRSLRQGLALRNHARSLHVWFWEMNCARLHQQLPKWKR